jgi:hypothetical protein
MHQHFDLLDAVRPNLGDEDDEELWRTVISVLAEEFERRVSLKDTHAFLWIGACSHWLRPHQSTWVQGGGFAWPAGYGDNAGFGHRGLPQFEWSVKFRFLHGSWQKAERFSGKQKTILRVAVPTRTARHAQAAIHSVWLRPRNKRMFWGFRKLGEEWRPVAVSDSRTQGRAIDPRYWSKPLRPSEYK